MSEGLRCDNASVRQLRRDFSELSEDGFEGLGLGRCQDGRDDKRD